MQISTLDLAESKTASNSELVARLITTVKSLFLVPAYSPDRQQLGNDVRRLLMSAEPEKMTKNEWNRRKGNW